MTKVIYALRSVSHFSYLESSIDALLERGAEVVIMFDYYWSHRSSPSRVAFDNWHCAHPNVEIGYFPVRKDLLRKPLMFARELRSFNSYCRRGDDAEFYRNRWSNYLKLPEKLRLKIIQKKYRRLFGATLLRKALTAIERFSPPDRRIVAWLRAQKADVLVASPCNMRFDNEIELIKAARKLSIPSVIPVLSWDNTSTKGLFHIHPTRVLAWHEGHKNDCVKYHGIGPKKVCITGSPFFDKWFGAASKPTPREEFCKRVGLDPKRPYVLYLGSSANIAPDETWLVRDLHAAMEISSDPRVKEMQILFRAHPANWKNGTALLDEGIGVWPREGTLPDSEQTFIDFRDSLSHAVCVVGLNTSGMLDAIINDKPLISPIVARYRLTQDKAEHFIRMKEHQTLYIARDVEGVVKYIAELRAGNDPLDGKRREFIDRFIRPGGRDVSAGARGAEVILGLAPQTSAQPKIPVMSKSSFTPKLPEHKPARIDTDVREVFGNFKQIVEKQRDTDLFRFYLETRDKILAMLKHYKMSAYWTEEVMGFDYLFDAGPLIATKIREHCYHITGERSYNYRQHHAHKAKPYLARLTDLQGLDRSNLFVPESEACGGFGHESPHGMVNLDTLKFYEVLIGLDKAGFLEDFKNERGKRKAMVEIGSGWGGFAYQFHTLFPNTTIFCIDLPPTLLFSAIYARGACPDARIAIYGDLPDAELFKRWAEFDFVFIPAHKIADFKPLQLDLAVNMCSFQEMTTAQVTEYVHTVADLGCKRLYSLNRDRSQHNPELSLVSSIMKERYDLTPLTLLPTEYCMVGTKIRTRSAAEIALDPTAYRHYAAKLR